MKTQETSWGVILTIEETKHNSEFSFRCRQVRKINDNCPYEQELIAELEQREQKALRKLKILMRSMEYFFRYQMTSRDCFAKWERNNKLDWNEWYHDQQRDLAEEVDNCSFEYAKRSKHGWCL